MIAMEPACAVDSSSGMRVVKHRCAYTMPCVAVGANAHDVEYSGEYVGLGGDPADPAVDAGVQGYECYGIGGVLVHPCLLYTSDAADDL